ncbi:unnamed protein product [Blepharisma stoltei]|uniref:Uncharacterized protein n=1 Tax=Blepharisma stoltei TaxID=1481888 RepID=A0AAU9ITQ9_9CILI|nr:unnamed protein product [Blepharisma stoltei]
MLIGRSFKCNLTIENSLLPKFYNQTSRWTLIDGNLGSQKPSTNGTLLFLKDGFKIYNETISKPIIVI